MLKVFSSTSANSAPVQLEVVVEGTWLILSHAHAWCFNYQRTVDTLHGNISLSDSNKEVGIVGRCLTYSNGVRSGVVPRGKIGVIGNM